MLFNLLKRAENFIQILLRIELKAKKIKKLST